VSLGPAEILVILVIALLVFGPNRLPEIGRQVGRGVREFRRFQDSIKGDLGNVFADDATDHAEPAPTLPPRELETGAASGAPGEPSSSASGDSAPGSPPTGDTASSDSAPSGPSSAPPAPPAPPPPA
jgi:TatA/E family protein of Tat protein translocase